MAKNIIDNARRVVIFTGAGISAESGINTFRDPESGTWCKKIDMLLYGTPMGWKIMPQTSWKKYLEFRKPIAIAEPNDAHKAIVKLEKKKNSNISIITQNIDGLHQKAGSKLDRVHELHGTVHVHKCINKWHKHPYTTSNKSDSYNYSEDAFFSENPSRYPKCRCGSYLRPDAVLFTEQLPVIAYKKALFSVKRLERGDCMIIIGTSGSVYPAAELVDIAIQKDGIAVIEINTEYSNFSNRVDIFLGGSASEILPKII